jgi:hypothetical protein
MSSISISPTSATMTHGNATPLILAALDATGPCTWQLIDGEIPPGCVLQGDSGATGARITGAPKAAGTFTPTVSCLDNGQTPPQYASQQISLTVD